jgi:hypothetical protein
MPKSKGELRFYPGPHTLIWVVDGKAQITAGAWGGEVANPKVKYATMKPRPTTPGRYVIYSYAPYQTATWAMSRIKWGTPLKLDSSGQHVMYSTGSTSHPWKKVEDKIPGATAGWIKAYYYRLYGGKGKYDTNHDGVPETWVFNDFGPRAVRYFQDLNRNKKLDGKESLSGEMIHTTPENEAQVDTGKDVTLVPSHGCIHVNPIERDQLYNAGAFERGTDLIIYSYKEAIPDELK